MQAAGYAQVTAAIAGAMAPRDIGRVRSLDAGLVTARGLSRMVALGDRVCLGGIEGEVVGAAEDLAHILPDGPPAGLSPGDPVRHLGPVRIAPDDSWIGRIVDPFGRPLDGRPLLPGTDPRPLAGPAPAAAARRGLGARVETGLRVFNTLLPIVRGQRIGLFSGSGVGKSTLLAGLAQSLEADIVVLALVGERGREMRHFVETVLGPDGMRRTIVVGATADRPAAHRWRCAQAAMTVAEHFRDLGLHVLFLCDSVTRMADAHREIALARGEPACFGGYPASMPAQIMDLAERAGPGADGAGDITAILSVLVAGNDMEGPVADTMRGVLDGHVVLDRGIAERGRFPAIDVLRSVSRALPAAASGAENTLITEARRLLGAFENAELMIKAGLYAKGSDKTVDAAILAHPRLDEFIGAREPEDIAQSFKALARCLSRGPAG